MADHRPTMDLVVKPTTAVTTAFSRSLNETLRRGKEPDARAALSCAQELRALGQALENQGLVSLNLVVKGGEYFVRGTASSPREPRSYFFDRVGKMIASGFGNARGPLMQSGEVAFQFSPERIRQLDREGRRMRVDCDQAPDPFKLSQLLRSAGCYVDSKRKVSFLGVTIKEQWLTVAYTTSDGVIEHCTEDLNFFYDYWIKMYLRRSDRPTPSLADGAVPLISRPGIIIG